MRPCFICQSKEECPHREPRVACAEKDAVRRRMREAQEAIEAEYMSRVTFERQRAGGLKKWQGVPQ